MPLTFHTDTPLSANARSLVPGRVYATLNTDPVEHSERLWVITQIYQTPQKSFRIKTHYWMPPQFDAAPDSPPRSPTQELDSYLFLNGWQPTGESKAGPGEGALAMLEFEAMRPFDASAQTASDPKQLRPTRRTHARQAPPPRVPQVR